MSKKEKGEVNTVKKILGLIFKIVYDILIVFCVLLIVVIFMQRITDSNRSIKGYRIFKVVSGSMVPKYDVGEVVICKDTPVENIKIGNSIVYRGKIDDLNGKLVMHEVIAINHNENNELTFFARGLNNSKGDPEISESQILGVVKLRSKVLTLLYKLATSIYSSFVIVTILVINVFISFKSGKVREENDSEDEEGLKSIDEQLQEIEEMENSSSKENKEDDVIDKDEKRSKKEKDVIDLQENIDKIENDENLEITVKENKKIKEKKSKTKDTEEE